jgi:hypothetical protein
MLCNILLDAVSVGARDTGTRNTSTQQLLETKKNEEERKHEFTYFPIRVRTRIKENKITKIREAIYFRTRHIAVSRKLLLMRVVFAELPILAELYTDTSLVPFIPL